VRSLVLAEFPEGIGVKRDYDVGLPEFRGDPEQLIQAVLNIARNARKPYWEPVQALRRGNRVGVKSPCAPGSPAK